MPLTLTCSDIFIVHSYCMPNNCFHLLYYFWFLVLQSNSMEETKMNSTKQSVGLKELENGRVGEGEGEGRVGEGGGREE